MIELNITDINYIIHGDCKMLKFADSVYTDRWYVGLKGILSVTPQRDECSVVISLQHGDVFKLNFDGKGEVNGVANFMRFGKAYIYYRRAMKWLLKYRHIIAVRCL